MALSKTFLFCCLGMLALAAVADALHPGHITLEGNKEHFQRVGRELVGKGSRMGTPRPPPWYRTMGRVRTYNIMNYGAKGNGKSDDSGAIIRAFQAACGPRHNRAGWARMNPAVVVVPAGRVFRISQFVAHPKGKAICYYVGFRVDGTLRGNRGTWGYNKGVMRGYINFGSMRNNWVTGRGLIDFNGMDWWRQPGKGPKGLTMLRCYFTYISGITIMNSGASSIVYDMGSDLKVELVTISTPGDSPNTDGVHLARCDRCGVVNSYIGSGDDAVVWQTECNDGYVNNVVCGPGSHGVSWGSMGNGVKTCMRNFRVTNVVFDRTQNGLHMKAWAGGIGALYNIYAANLMMINVDRPINVNQEYSGSHGSGSVAIYGSTIENVRGTSAKYEGIIVNCLKNTPCGLRLRNIKLFPGMGTNGKKVPALKPICMNAFGAYDATVQPRLVGCKNGMPPNMNTVKQMAKSCSYQMTNFMGR